MVDTISGLPRNFVPGGGGGGYQDPDARKGKRGVGEGRIR